MTKRRNGMRDGESGREKSSPRKIEELSRERARERDSAADSFCRSSERGEYFGVG